MKKMIFALVTSALLSTAFAAQSNNEVNLINSVTKLDNGISVEWNESGTVAIQLYSINGRVIHSISRQSITAGATSTIPLDGVSSGVYYMTIDNGRSTQQVTIAK